MKKKLKLISVLSLILIAMLSVCSVSYAKEYDDTEEVRAILKTVGVIAVEEGEAYDPASEITRVKYLEWILNAVKADESAYATSARQIFFDVAAGDEIAPLVNLGYDLGIITGHSDGRFCPDETITINEATIMAIRAAGASDFISTSGDWTQVAVSLNLLDKVSTEAGGAVIGTTAERIVFNMLNAGLVQSDDGKTWYIDGNTSLLEMKHKIERATGIVDANSYANIYGGSKLPIGQVSIDNTVYEIEVEYDGLFAGENVVFYYEKDRYSGTSEKIVYICSGRNEIVEVDTDFANVLDALSFEYYTEDDKKQEVEISAKAVFLENGIKTTEYALPKYGSIKLIDNNNDSEADVVFISNITMSVVNTVVNEVVYLSTKPATNIKLEEYSRVIIKNKAGEVLGLDAITAGSLTEIFAASDKSYIEIVVLNDTATVVVKGMEERDSNGYSVWYLTDEAGNEYRTVREFESVHPDNKLVMGASHNVLLSSDGYIAAIAGDIVGGEMQYGYVLKPFEKEPLGEGNIYLRILAADGNIIEFPARNKLTNVTTGESISKTLLMTLCADKQVIRYGVNSQGELNKIEFASTDPNAEGFKKGPETLATRTGYYTRYYSANSLVGPNIPVDNNTIIFLVPDAEYANDYSKYHVVKKDGLVNQKYYQSLKSYMYGDDFYAKALIYSSTATEVSKSDPKILVSYVNTVYDEAEDMTKPMLVGYSEGGESTYSLVDENLIKWTPADGIERTIGEGDVIRVSLDHKGKISDVVVVFDYSEKKLYADADQDGESADYNTSVVHAYGKVAQKYENNTFFRVLRNGETEESASSSYLYPITKSYTFIYEYDSEQKRGQRIKNITLADVMTLEDDPALEDEAVMVTQDYRVPFMVIYK